MTDKISSDDDTELSERESAATMHAMEAGTEEGERAVFNDLLPYINEMGEFSLRVKKFDKKDVPGAPEDGYDRYYKCSSMPAEADPMDFQMMVAYLLGLTDAIHMLIERIV